MTTAEELTYLRRRFTELIEQNIGLKQRVAEFQEAAECVNRVSVLKNRELGARIDVLESVRSAAQAYYANHHVHEQQRLSLALHRADMSASQAHYADHHMHEQQAMAKALADAEPDAATQENDVKPLPPDRQSGRASAMDAAS